MRRTIVAILAVFAAGAVATAQAQSPTIDHLSQSDLMEKARMLEPAAAAADGSASKKLAEYPNHFTMIALREKNGGAEVHQKYADFFFVLKGQATLTTGGTVVDGKETTPGEIRGSLVKDGSQVSLHEGDIVHIPANVPHQLLLANGDTFVYFVIKVLEK
jgi:mannose-6-phosphate isomerase-like protein (cupin superfamily)